MFASGIALWELLSIPVYVLVGMLAVFLVKNVRYRKIFAFALLARVAGSIGFSLIYLIYYEGGDTIAYFGSAVPFFNLILQNPTSGLIAILEPYSAENFSLFSASTGYPQKFIYMSTDTFSLVRILVPMFLVTFKSYLLTSITLAMITVFGPWKLFLLLDRLVPNFTRWIAFSVLFFPSALFWGSGISKDTITFSATCYFIYGFYTTVIERNYRWRTIILTVLALYLILQIKAYIIMGIMPGAILWFFSDRIARIKNDFLRYSITPFVFFTSALIFAIALSQFGAALGEYSPGNILNKAIVTQEDLKRDYYGGNSFDIGTVDPSIFGVLSKFPIATFFGFFGPTLLHVRNPVMLMSALENTYLLVLTLLILIRVSPRRLASAVLGNPLLLFCLLFSVLFAFSIGFSTSNFGALVRFKIPILPFYTFLLHALYIRIRKNGSLGTPTTQAPRP